MIVFRRALMILAATPALFAQTAPQLSPAAAYEAATSPVAIVHRSVGNWSDSEAASLAVAIRNGAEACAARKAENYSGDQLIAYARLCTLGQNWAAGGDAAGLYIASTDPQKPQLALAYAIQLEAALHANDVKESVTTATAMLAANPYDATVDAAFGEAVEYMQLAYTEDALGLLQVREPLLLAALRTPKPILPQHTLYADGLAMAALQQYAGVPEDAAKTVADLDQALGAEISQDERLMIEEARQGYAMLGQPLPKIVLQLSLLNLKTPAPIDPDQGMSTALLIFPGWCAQCVRMTALDLGHVSDSLGKNGVRIHALLAGPLAEATALLPEPAPAREGAVKRVPLPPPPGPPTAASALQHTDTIVVPPETLRVLHASDFPFLIVLDRQGKVRFAQAAPESALRPGDFATRAAEHVGEQWPQRSVPAVIQ